MARQDFFTLYSMALKSAIDVAEEKEPSLRITDSNRKAFDTEKEAGITIPAHLQCSEGLPPRVTTFVVIVAYYEVTRRIPWWRLGSST
jgi:hypothetical protein